MCFLSLLSFWIIHRRLEHLENKLVQLSKQGVSKNRNTFDLEYLKDGSFKLIVLLVCFSVLPYNSIEYMILAFCNFLKQRYWVSKYEYDFQGIWFIYQNWEVILFHNQIIFERILHSSDMKDIQFVMFLITYDDICQMASLIKALLNFK